jgi:acyl-[acyl-carrier-protein] desaturase
MTTPAPAATESADFHARQVGTTEQSAAARLDRETEDKLYRLYRAFFAAAEDERNWNLWEDVPWDEAKPNPPDELVAEAMAAYREGLFIPDYSASALKALRASRGRAWFLTRWSYEESKHVMALNEWFVRAGVHTDLEMKAVGDTLLATYRYEPPYPDPVAIFLDSLLWERAELVRFTAVKALAESAGDTALLAVVNLCIKDERAHEEFLKTALNIIAEKYPDAVEDATRRVTRAA